MPAAITAPDLSDRRFPLTLERFLVAPPHVLFAAWTRHFDRWFAAPGSVLMEAKVNGVSFSRPSTRAKDVQPGAIPTVGVASGSCPIAWWSSRGSPGRKAPRARKPWSRSNWPPKTRERARV